MNFQIHVDDLDRVLAGAWTELSRPLNCIHMTKIVDQHLEITILLCMIGKGTFIRYASKCCMPCAIQALERAEWNWPRFMINFAVQSSQQIY